MMSESLTVLLLALVVDLNDEVLCVSLSGELLELLGSRLEGVVDFHEGLIKFHQLIESSDLELRLLNLCRALRDLDLP